MIKAIFFDFNGVIIDDETIQMKAYQEILRGHEIDLTEEWYMSALGMDDRTFVKAMFERAKRPLTDPVLETVLNTKTDLHRQMMEDGLPLFPGVVTFLKATSRHFSIGLVSMATIVEVGYVFQRANLTPLFSDEVLKERSSRLQSAIRLLIQAGADINARSRWWAGGFGVLDWAPPGVAMYAIERGATVTIHAAARLGRSRRLGERSLSSSWSSTNALPSK